MRCASGVSRQPASTPRASGVAGPSSCSAGAGASSCGSAREAAQIVRPAGLGAGAGQAFAAERLHAHHGADDVAVDVDVADAGVVRQALGAAVDAGLDAQREAVAQAVDLGNDLVHRVLEAHDVQHGAEDLLAEVGDARCSSKATGSDLARHGTSRTGASAISLASRLRRSTCRLMLAWASSSMTGPTSVASCSGLPTHSCCTRALQHLDDAVGDAGLHAQQAQRRAALAGGAEGALHDGVDDLLGQRRRVHHHRVQAAGFGDQRDG